MEKPWCLVLVIWGERYTTAEVNRLVTNVLKFSNGCDEIILITDYTRKDLHADITQKPFPIFFNRDLFFKPGYIAKLSLFSNEVLPANKACVYLDLDTVVFGDIGKIADLVTAPNDLFILPSVFWEITFFTRVLTKLSFGQFYKVGNSSIMAYHSSANPNLCAEFETLFTPEHAQNEAKFKIDDVFISWFARYYIRPVPRSLGVMFRKEFLGRSRLGIWLKAHLSYFKNRRKNLVAVTLNGFDLKSQTLMALKDGAYFADNKGRFSRWDDVILGGFKAKFIQFLKDEN